MSADATSETTRPSIMGEIARTSRPGNPVVGTVLAMSAEVHRLTTCVLEPVMDQYRLVAWQQAANDTERSLDDLFTQQLVELGDNLHRRLWDDEIGRPFTESMDMIGRPPVEHIAIAASPQQRTRVWLTGISERHSIAAAHSAIESTQALVVGTTTLASQAEPAQVADELQANGAEIMVLVGGYEVAGEVQESLIELARFVAETFEHLSEDARPVLYYAGNGYAYETLASLLFSHGIRIERRVDNVSPQPGVTRAQPLTQAIDEAYHDKCRRSRGFEEMERWSTVDGELLTVETSFVRMIQLWLDFVELPELYGIYTGANRWLHVWADAETNRVLVNYTAPDGPSTIKAWRPDVRLVSGLWPDNEALPGSVTWWDSRGFAPIIAAAALASPKAAIEVLRNDIFIEST